MRSAAARYQSVPFAKDVELSMRLSFGWFAGFAGMDMAASSERTRDVLGWQPTGPDLLSDIDQPGYFERT